MAHCKNVGGAPIGASGGDGGDDGPHHLTTAEKGKKVVSKKTKITNKETETARAVIAIAEASGRRGTLRIGTELSSA
jgi:hypothetical protein